jgi:inorganic pyrophosphatase
VAAKRGPADGLVEVRVEIPRGSRNKYEYDPDRQMFRLDRRLFSATVYPADYGFVLDTLADTATRWTPWSSLTSQPFQAV